MESPISLTGLPRKHELQRGTPWKTLRSDLKQSPDIELDPPAPGFPDCFVMVSLPAVGPPHIAFGPGSVQVTN
jgi:hypothetical protein